MHLNPFRHRYLHFPSFLVIGGTLRAQKKCTALPLLITRLGGQRAYQQRFSQGTRGLPSILVSTSTFSRSFLRLEAMLPDYTTRNFESRDKKMPL